jgi:cytochrome P450
MLLAGHETTSNMISLAVLTLLQHPDQLADVRDTDDPKVVANAMEEVFRYHTIALSGRRRVAKEDVVIRGQLIKAGEGLIGASDVANRDERSFPEPDRFDIHRQAKHHMAFGYGNHQCLGQPLARAQLQVAVPSLLRRLPTLRLAVPFDEVPFRHDMGIYGLHELPVTW